MENFTELEGAISKHIEIHGDDKIHKPSLSSFILIHRVEFG